MGIVSNTILMISGVYLALGLIYLRFWWAERVRTAYLTFSISCLLSSIYAWFELGMMHSRTPEEYLFYAWWAFLPGTAALIALAWLAYLHLHGRKWLFVTHSAGRILAVVLHLGMANGIHFRQVTSVGQRTILGETLSYPIAVQNPWMLVPHLSHLLLVIFFLDSTVRCWRRGEHRTALTFGTGTILFGLTTLIVPTSVLWGLVSIPVLGSFAILSIVLVVLYELNYDMHRAAMLSEELEERETRLTETLDQLQLSAAAANVGMWTRKIGDDNIWVSEKAGEIWEFPSGEQFTRDAFFQKIHPADRDLFHKNILELEEGKSEFQLEYRILSSDGNVRWIHSRGKVEPINGDRFIRGAIVDITKLKMVEGRLTDTLDQLRLAQQAARMGTFEWNIQTGKNTWSPELEKMYGLAPGTFAGSQAAWEDLVHPEDRDRAQLLVQHALESGEPREGEWRVILPDGRVRWIFGRFQGFVDEAGKPLRLAGINIDVSERKAAEEALRESESFNRTILSSLNTHVCVLDRYGQIISVNHAWAAFALDNGLASEASVGPGVNYLGACRRAVTDGDELARRALDGVRAVCDGTQDYFTLESPCHSPIEKRWFLMIVTPLQGGNGGAVVVHNDITHSKLAAEAVRESEERFRNMAETAPVMIWISDENQATTYVNNRWLQFTGSTLERELGHAWTKHLHPDDLGPTNERGNSAFEKRIPFELEFRLRRADGDYRWVFSSGAPRFSFEGDFLGYIGTSIDITERKHSETALRQANDELDKLKNQLLAENIYLQEELRQDQAFGDIVGHSAAIKNVLFKISQVAPTDATVLIVGETGTGKELVARAIHDASQRKDRPLIKVNCAALSPSLIESELFGHEKGAFTGAAAKKLGRFELADSGTLLLDEIGELPLDLQSKLLRVLQEGEFERVGSGTTIKTDVRILASTNRDLKEAVEKGRFREDLWYRLNVFPIAVPPLRGRRDDIPLLTEHFARIFARKFGKDLTAISPEALPALCAYSWPGNIRELANVIERAVINLHGTVLKILEDFPIREADMLAAPVLTLEYLERDHIRRVLDDLNWRIDGPKGAARVLGINPSTLRTRMARLGISKPK